MKKVQEKKPLLKIQKIHVSGKNLEKNIFSGMSAPTPQAPQGRVAPGEGSSEYIGRRQCRLG